MSASRSRRLVLRLLLASGVAALAACGRKANPVPPLDADPRAPRHYPVDPLLRAPVPGTPGSDEPPPLPDDTPTPPPQTSPLRSPIESIYQ